MQDYNDNQNGENLVEVRFFGQLKQFADQKGWPFPAVFKLDKECSALELAEKMGVPKAQVEAVFINGVAKPIEEGWVKPGDRIGYIPYGVPGPYRVLLGIRKTDKE